jgi:outer membrane protein TolC
MSKLYFLIASFVTLCISSAYAQTEINIGESQSRLLSVEEMFRLADENNRRIKVHSTAIAEAEANARTAKNAYLPSVNASLSLGYNGNGTITDRDFSNSFMAPIPHFGNNFALEVSQVIYAGGAISNGVKIAELQSQIAALNAENNRREVRFLIAGNYLELCKLQNQLQIFESHINLTHKVLDNMRLRRREGTALQNDITRYELQLQNLNYAKIQLQNTKQILNNQLTAALGLPSSLVIVPDTANAQNLSDENGDYWRHTALASSSPVNIAKTAVKISEYREKIVRAERLPQIALFAADYLDGPIAIDIPAINKNFNYWAVGVGIKYNIGNLYKSDKTLRASRLARQKANEERDVAEEEIALAVQAAYIHYREAFDLLATKEKSVELAGRNYDVVSYRYDNDLALITDLLDASAQKLDAELQAVNARINIIYNHYKLKYVAGTL